MTKKNSKKSKKVQNEKKVIFANQISKEQATREHAEFHNCYTSKTLKQDIKFLHVIYGDKCNLTPEMVDEDFLAGIKSIGKEIYFFISSISSNITPQIYIKRKYEFIVNKIPNGDKNLFYLAWNGLTKNDSFKRILRQKFSIKSFNDQLCPKEIPAIGSTLTRYRTKLVVADDMGTDSEDKRRTKGRLLDDGSGLIMREGIIWLPNGKAMPLFPQAYVPLNQTQVILLRHGRSVHNSGGDNPKFVGSGYWDHWDKNRRISGGIGNQLHEEGIETARKLGRDFKVVVDCLNEKGYSLWPWSKDKPIKVFGSESENTEQTSRYFLQEAEYTNISFNAYYGLNSQKYGALTHKYKGDIFDEMIKIYGEKWKGSVKEKRAKAKSIVKNRFYHYPEGETLIEADWRIAYSFLKLLDDNLGNRIVLADHSGAIRVFAAIVKTLDFADYKSLKEDHDSIIAMCYQPGKNVRYDYIQYKDYLLRKNRK